MEFLSFFKMGLLQKDWLLVSNIFRTYFSLHQMNELLWKVEQQFSEISLHPLLSQVAFMDNIWAFCFIYKLFAHFLTFIINCLTFFTVIESSGVSVSHTLPCFLMHKKTHLLGQWFLTGTLGRCVVVIGVQPNNEFLTTHSIPS